MFPGENEYMLDLQNLKRLELNIENTNSEEPLSTKKRRYDSSGVSVDEKEKKRLNEHGGNILREAGLDFEESKDYDWIKKETIDYGYAGFYLRQCWNDSKLINEADVGVYKTLVDIDTNLGTDLSFQLWLCLRWTARCDIIKV